MITAIDTNVLLDVLVEDQTFCAVSANYINQAANEGLLVICDIVYAELCIHFNTQHDCDDFLIGIEIGMEPLKREAHFLASRAWRIYRSQGGQRTRILADLFVGAHATLQADRLLTRDRGFHRKLFPKLTVLDPSLK